MKSIHIVFLLSLICLTSCSGDNIDGDKDALAPPSNHLLIRFVSPFGTNILDSLGVGGEPYMFADKKDIQVKCINTWDGEVMELLDFAWRKISPGYYYWKHNTKEDNTSMPTMTEGTVLYISWGDLNLITDHSRPVKYDTSYFITIKSPLVFGNDEVHTIKWDVKVDGRLWDACNWCEIDGKKYSLVGDVVYDYWSIYFGEELPSSRRHNVEAQVTMTVNR